MKKLNVFKTVIDLKDLFNKTKQKLLLFKRIQIFGSKPQ